MNKLKLFTEANFSDWDRFYRANFVSALSGFKSAALIGTQHENKQGNLAVFSNIVHLGANPSLVGLVNRPREASPHTLSNIERTGFFTINLISNDFVTLAHHCSAKYSEGVSEFQKLGLGEEYINDFAAPFVKESAVKSGFKLIEIVPVKHNNTFFIIGELVLAAINEPLLQNDGFVDLNMANVLCSQGIDSYAQPGKNQRFSYAKADKE